MTFNNALLDLALESFTESGVSGNRENKLIVSLTTFPPRMGIVHYAVFSLLSQTLKPDAVILWLAEEEYPGGEKDLPQPLLALRDNGLSIRWTTNIRSYKKLVPALREFPDSIIVTADDDLLYVSDWLERLYADYEANGRRTMVYAHRAHKVALDDAGNLFPYTDWTPAKDNRPGTSFLNFATGGGGILYPPGALHPDVTDEERFLSLAPHADDLWFWAMAVLNGTMTRCVENCLRKFLLLNITDSPDRLWRYNIAKGGNDIQFKKVLAAYPDIAVNLLAELRLKLRKQKTP